MNKDFETGIWRRLWPLVTAQFLGVFNDHAFKTVAVFAAIGNFQSYSRNARFLGLVTVAYALPFILLPALAGFFSDRFAKRNVVVLAKFAEIIVMALGILCFARIESWGFTPLLGIMFLMSMQSTMFSPAFNGYLPELFSEKEISRVNGINGMLTYIAAILGMGGGILLKSMLGDNLTFCGIACTVIAAVGFLAALNVVPGLAANRRRSWSWNWLRETLAGLRLMAARRPVMMAILGDAFFVGAGTAMQLLLLLYGKYTLGIERELGWGILQLMMAVGIGLGCYLAGRASGGKVELGLVPFGAAGMAFFLVLTAFFPGPAMASSIGKLYPLLLGHLFLAGVTGGFFIVPLRAYVQEKTLPRTRGTVIASGNVLCFLAILLAGTLMLGFAVVKELGENPEAIASHLRNSVMLLADIDAPLMLAMLALLTVVVTGWAFWMLPEFALRFIAVTLTHSVYRLQIRGAENIPERGPAMLVSNHVSLVDGFLISTCSSRNIRFLMYEDYYNLPALHHLFRWLGFIGVPAPGKPKALRRAIELTREALRNGDIVCIFPEGKLTRNGVMDEFRGGLTHMLPDGIDVPVIPVRLGMIWGSIFSHYHGRIRPRIPMEFPHPAAVTVGTPVSRDTPPFALRQLISELAAETEMIPRREERPLHYRFAKLAKRHPRRISVMDQDGSANGNFKLLLRSIMLSREIRRICTEEEPYVGIMLPNCTPAVISVLAVMMSDRCPAMLNFTVAGDSLRQAIDKAGIRRILTSRKFVAKAKIAEQPEFLYLEDIAKQVSTKTKLFWTVLTAVLPHQELMNIVAPVSHRDVFRTAVLLFSSGSTGSPKAVMLSHHNLNSNVASFVRIVDWNRNKDRILGNLPLFHSFGFLTACWIPLMTGSRVVYLPNPLDAAASGELIEKYGLSILLATPTFLQAYMRKCRGEQFRSVRLAVTGAEKLRPDIADKFREMTGITVIEGYGCTELSPVVSINITNSMLELGTGSGPQGSVGMPIPGVCVKIVDPDTGESLGPRQEGLMLVKGPNVMQGYLGEPEKTAELIRDGWYNTGDIAQMDPDGRISITGRLSRFSKIGGEMVPHELVETRMHELLASDERVLAVTGAPDQAKGEKLLVFHSPNLGESPGNLVKYLREDGRLPNLWIPKPENFRQIDELPLLGSGKLDLKKLQSMAK